MDTNEQLLEQLLEEQQEMKKRHNVALFTLQCEQNLVLSHLIAKQIEERNELKKQIRSTYKN